VVHTATKRIKLANVICVLYTYEYIASQSPLLSVFSPILNYLSSDIFPMTSVHCSHISKKYKNICSPHYLLKPMSVMFQKIILLILACSDSKLIPKLWIFRYFVEPSELGDLFQYRAMQHLQKPRHSHEPMCQPHVPSAVATRDCICLRWHCHSLIGSFFMYTNCRNRQ
jgi:hypothetical protein